MRHATPIPVSYKLDYISRIFQNTTKKRIEHYVITRIWHLLNTDEIQPISQQPVRRPNGQTALTDLYFPQLSYHIEVDEFVTPENSAEQYWRRYSTAHSDRKLDDLGVKSGVAQPSWDETLIPCGTEFFGESF